MLISTSGVFDLSLRYVFQRGRTYYYQRRIPKDLRDRYGGLLNVKVNLKTTDPIQLAKQVTSLNKKYEATWHSLRSNPESTPATIRQSAVRLLGEYGLKPLPAANDEHNLDIFIDTLKAKHEEYAKEEELEWDEVSPEHALEAVEVEALRLLNESPRFRLSDALAVYLNGHQKKNDKKFVTYTARVWDRLIEFLGDREFEQVSRSDANSFVTNGLARGSKTTTVDRQISVIRAVFKVAINEREIPKTNPFLSLRIAGLGEDSVSRGTFEIPQLHSLYGECSVGTTIYAG
jgi:hypothetical protein